jgi:beta-lactamase class A
MREFGNPPESSSNDDRPLHRQLPQSGLNSRRDRRLPVSRPAQPQPLKGKQPRPSPPAQTLGLRSTSNAAGDARRSKTRDQSQRDRAPRRGGILAGLLKLPVLRQLANRPALVGKSTAKSRLPMASTVRVNPLASEDKETRGSVTPPLQVVAPTATPKPLRQRRERAVKKTPLNPPSFSGAELPRTARTRMKSSTALVYGTRLLILGIGMGVIVGTILSIWDPASRFMAGAQGEKKSEVAAAKVGVPPASEMRLDQEIASLRADVQDLVTQQKDLTTGVLFVDLDTNSYIDINATQSFSAASTIKFPILVAFFEAVDAGKIPLDETLTMRKDLVASESGDMQYLPVGTKFSALETVSKMITVSDNTATNMIIDRVGGKAFLNQRFQTWGLTNTSLRNVLPDLEGTNTTSPKDMVTLMAMINEGKLLSLRSRDRLLDIMRRTANNSLLPKGLEPTATIAHKTGDIGSLVGDVGMIDTPNGRRYLATVLVKRPFNDDRAQELIRQISQTTYKYFSQPLDFSQAKKPAGQNDPTRQIDNGEVKIAEP